MCFCLISTADCGDYVVVTNARQVAVTGKKAEQKVYRSHSQFPGGQKVVPYARMMERKPEMVSDCVTCLASCRPSCRPMIADNRLTSIILGLPF